MNIKHLTEEILQLYALDPDQCEPAVSEHLKICQSCKAELENYQSLFKGITEQEVPVFEFNLSELVLSGLPSTQPRRIHENAFVIMIMIIATILICTVIYLFRDYAIELFSFTRPMILYITITSVLCLLCFLCMDMYRQYQQKMKSLDIFLN